MENISSSQMPELEPRRNYWDSFLKVLPLVQWILTLVIAVAVFGLGFRDTQTSQSAEINRIINDQKAIRDTMNERKTTRDKEFDELRKQMLTRDVFSAYMDSIKDELTRQRGMIEKLLERK